MEKFYNHMKQEFVSEAVEEIRGRWFIKIGFSGFNSSANNFNGYDTKLKAEQAVLRYQSK